MRLILLTGLLVATFVFGFLFAHEPFRQVVIEKTVRTFFSDEEPAREAPPAPAPQRMASDRPGQSGKPAPAPTKESGDQLTEKDRRSLDDLFEEKLDDE